MKELEDYKAATEPKVKELEGKVTTLTTDVTKLTGTVKDKDLIIEQKNKDIVGARQETQTLKKLTEEDKKAMSEAEIRLHNSQLKLQEDMETFAKTQNEARVKEVTSRQEAIIRKMSGGREDIAKAMRENFAKLDPALRDKATTEEEITPLMNSAYEMLGALKPSAIDTNINADGGAPGGEGGKKDDFSTTEGGKELLKAMGLPTEDPKPAVVTPPAVL